MRLHDAIHEFEYAQRADWCGEYIVCNSTDLDIHQMPGPMTRPLTVKDVMATDWSAYHLPYVGEGVI